MNYHYDWSGSEPIQRDFVVGDAADIKLGAAVAKEGAITTALDQFAIGLANPATLENIVGVSNEFYDYSAHKSGPERQGANSATVVATGVSNYMKVIINPFAVYTAEVSQAAADDTVNTAASTGGKVTTATFTTDREGDWIYVTDVGSSAGGAGNLYKIGASTSTTSVTACTSYDDNMATTNTSDTFIVVTNSWSALAAGGSLDLRTDGTQTKGVAVTGSGAIAVIDAYVQDASTPPEPLKVERNSGKTYDANTCKLLQDIFFTEHIVCGSAVRIVA